MTASCLRNAIRNGKGFVAAASALALLDFSRDSGTDENRLRSQIAMLEPRVACSSSASFRNRKDSPLRVANTEQAKIRSVSRLARHNTVRMLRRTRTISSLASRYKVDWGNPLGEGAFGAVYLAIDSTTGERVAMKKISKEFTDDKGFQREMDALNHIRQAGGHPNICGLRENFDEGDFYFLALDLVSGGEMFDHLCELGAYSEADAARLVREVAGALAFLHGIGVVHSDLKPENLMLSTKKCSNATIKIVDFGSSQVRAEDSTLLTEPTRTGKTPAYCPPEVLKQKKAKAVNPSMDIYALGVILYIMLTGVHPYDLTGDTPDDQIVKRVKAGERPPLRGSPVTAHLSDSAISLIEKLMAKNAKHRMTALEMLEHPWVRGETARQDKIADSDKKLSNFRVFKSRLEAKVFENIISWSDSDSQDEVSKRTSLIERSFHCLDPERKGFITTRDLRELATDAINEDEATDGSGMSLSSFENLLSENMRSKYFPKGHIIYGEGDVGNHMYFINSGTLEVFTKSGDHSTLTQGDFFGEGALLHPQKIRSSSIRCVTPVHAIEVRREYFEKYLAASETGKMTLREKNRIRRRNRAKMMLRLQKNIKPLSLEKGKYLYKSGEQGQDLYILEDGVVDVKVEDYTVFTLREPGNVCGEHALITGRKRNSSAVCVSDECKMQVMRGKDFFDLLHSSESVNESIRDLSLRREVLKAIVFKTKRPFPSDPKDLKEAFEAADEDNSGSISLENLRGVLQRYDPNIPEKDLVDTVSSLDLNDSGGVTFEEFQRIFGIGHSV